LAIEISLISQIFAKNGNAGEKINRKKILATEISLISQIDAKNANAGEKNWPRET